ncbi:MAG: aldose 1-epimerase [Bacteroidota bacterium]|nr:aldose 1-epimerase [Bacteroidota bacterium]
MPFSIRHFHQDGLSLVSLKDENSGSEAVLLPGYGAALHAFKVATAVPQHNGAGEMFNVVDNYTSLEQVKNEMGVNFKGPKLSPFPCRIADATYRFAGAEYRFEKTFFDGTAIHGLLFDKSFAVTDEVAGKTSASVILQHRYNKENAAYPFIYDCAVKYILHPENLLEVQTIVTNLDKTTIPIADGWHPYFRLGGKIDDWLLRFNSEMIVDFDEHLIPTGHLMKYDDFCEERRIGSTQLDNCFVLGTSKTGPACELSNPSTGLRISLFPDSGYPYLQIYTPPDRQTIAIENLSAAPDCFNNKMGLILLPPGHSQTFTVNYKVSVR